MGAQGLAEPCKRSMPDRNPSDKPPRRSPPRWRSHSAKIAGQARPHGSGKSRASERFAAGRRGWRSGRGEDEGPAILYGWHTVLAALENPARKFHRLLATENAARRLAEAGVALPRTPEIVRPDAIVALVGPEAVHQGLYAETDPAGMESALGAVFMGTALLSVNPHLPSSPAEAGDPVNTNLDRDYWMLRLRGA